MFRVFILLILSCQGAISSFCLGVQAINGVGFSVQTPEGNPAFGAKVGIAVLLKPSLVVLNDGFGGDSEYKDISTDIAGKFVLPHIGEDYTIFIIHENGYAWLRKHELSPEGIITLRKWAGVQGKLMRGVHPMAEQQMQSVIRQSRSYGDPAEPTVSFKYICKTDSHGNFKFEQLPDGLATVGISVDSYVISHGQPVELVSGETQKITVGGNGRPVSGKVVVPDDYKDVFDLTQGSGLEIYTESLNIPVHPQDRENMTREEKDKWFGDWFKSKEGVEFLKKEFFAKRSYIVEIDHDGNFRAEDVPPGDYTFYYRVMGRNNKDVSGSAIKRFSIAEIEDDNSKEVYTLGNMALSVSDTIKLNTKAPEFTIKDFKGEEIKLSDYAGKYVLLDFWATWCGFCIYEFPDLKLLYDRYKDNDNFVIISISIDTDVSLAKEKIESEKILWPQGIDTSGWSAKVIKDYKISGIPAIFLISPEGNIIARQLRGTDMVKTVDKYLKDQ